MKPFGSPWSNNCPVILLSELYVAIGSEPWRIPDIANLPAIKPSVVKQGEEYIPYKRDPKTLARNLPYQVCLVMNTASVDWKRTKPAASATTRSTTKK